MEVKVKPMNIIAGITATLALFAGVIAFDGRYTKEDDFTTAIEEVKVLLEDAKTDIIDEMRMEVVKNRTVMIGTMQREADNLEWQMMELDSAEKPVPRYMTEKHNQIKRQIEALKDNEDTD